MGWQNSWDYEKPERRAAEDADPGDWDRPSRAELADDDRRTRVLSRAQFTPREDDTPTIEDEMERRAWANIGKPDEDDT